MDDLDFAKDEVLAGLLQRAADNRHSSFTFIRSLAERHAAKLYYNASLMAANNFKLIKKLLLHEHYNNVINNINNIDVILAAKHLDPVIKFYEDEANIIKDSLGEYRAYLFGGHLFDSIVLGAYRRDEDCVDFRKLPWRLF